MTFFNLVKIIVFTLSFHQVLIHVISYIDEFVSEFECHDHFMDVFRQIYSFQGITHLSIFVYSQFLCVACQ